MTMKTLAEYAHGFARMVRLEKPQPPAPEPLARKPLPMVGLFSQLTPEQKKFVLNYDGPSNVGGKEFRLGEAGCRQD